MYAWNFNILTHKMFVFLKVMRKSKARAYILVALQDC